MSEEARLVRGAGSVGRLARLPSSRREVLGVSKLTEMKRIGKKRSADHKLNRQIGNEG